MSACLGTYVQGKETTKGNFYGRGSNFEKRVADQTCVSVCYVYICSHKM